MDMKHIWNTQDMIWVGPKLVDFAPFYGRMIWSMLNGAGAPNQWWQIPHSTCFVQPLNLSPVQLKILWSI